MLADFGVAFWPSEEARFKSYTPLEIRPPEARFEPDIPLSFASDIWSLGCIIWAMLSHRSLFDAMWGQTEDEVTAQQADALGPLPAEWREKWQAWPRFFTQAGGTPKSIEGRCVWPLDRTFEEHILNPRRERGMAAPDAKEREAFLGCDGAVHARVQAEGSADCQGASRCGVDEGAGAARMSEGLEILINSTCKYMYYVGYEYSGSYLYEFVHDTDSLDSYSVIMWAGSRPPLGTTIAKYQVR
jgi:hypothetical protein